MKIAIDVSQMCYQGTGVARYLSGLTQALLNLDSPHEFVLYAGTLRQRKFFKALSHTPPWNRATWKIFPLPPKLAGYALNDAPIPFELLTGPVDLIHTSDWSEPFSRLPKVTTVHDLVFREYPETVDPLILSTQTRRFTSLEKGQTHLIADSESTKNDLMKRYHFPSTRITVIYPGIDPQYKPAKKQEVDRVKKKYHLPPRYLLSVGTAEPRKNLARLIEACQGLPETLVLTGNPGWGQQPAGSQILKLGFVDEADLPALYTGAFVFVYPSLYEGFGFPVAEGMACGTPVVTSKTSSLPEVGGSSAVLVDPLSIASIRSGIKLAGSERSVRIKAGLSQAAKFTWEQTAGATLEVYEKIAHRH